ncbi:MAG: MobC family plasmid mobilization relaxosome protein [Bacteroidota bacterium]
MPQSSDSRKKYLKTVKRKECVFSLNEYEFIQLAAKRHNRSESQMIKESVMAYLRKGFVVPDEKEVKELKLSLRRIGNNINQIARYANTHKSESPALLVEAMNKLKEIDEVIVTCFERPISIEVFIQKGKEQYDLFIPRLQ